LDEKKKTTLKKKPVLSSQLNKDPESLKKKLLEKEAQAALNRQKEREKLTAKLMAQEKHAKTVLMRKKAAAAMDGSSEDEERVSCGGENESASGSDKPSRVSSGKSTETDTTDVGEDSMASSEVRSSVATDDSAISEKIQARTHQRVAAV
jgi:hypothetical protein